MHPSLGLMPLQEGFALLPDKSRVPGYNIASLLRHHWHNLMQTCHNVTGWRLLTRQLSALYKLRCT